MLVPASAFHSRRTFSIALQTRSMCHAWSNSGSSSSTSRTTSLTRISCLRSLSPRPRISSIATDEFNTTFSTRRSPSSMRLAISTSPSRVSSEIGPHLAHVHAHRIAGPGGAVGVLFLLGLDLRLDLGLLLLLGVVVGRGLVLRRRLDDLDALVSERRQPVVHLIGRHGALGHTLADLVVGQESLGLADRDQLALVAVAILLGGSALLARLGAWLRGECASRDGGDALQFVGVFSFVFDGNLNSLGRFRVREFRPCTPVRHTNLRYRALLESALRQRAETALLRHLRRRGGLENQTGVALGEVGRLAPGRLCSRLSASPAVVAGPCTLPGARAEGPRGRRAGGRAARPWAARRRERGRDRRRDAGRGAGRGRRRWRSRGGVGAPGSVVVTPTALHLATARSRPVRRVVPGRCQARQHEAEHEPDARASAEVSRAGNVPRRPRASCALPGRARRPTPAAAERRAVRTARLVNIADPEAFRDRRRRLDAGIPSGRMTSAVA